MIHRSLPYELTPEDRLTRAKWARGVGIIYGTILLLLLTIAMAYRILTEPKGVADSVNTIPQVRSVEVDPRSNTTTHPSTAPRATKSNLHIQRN
jgi:hypothetical protein